MFVCLYSINCTHATGFNMREVPSSLCQKTANDEVILDCFKVNDAASSVLGRCFIEVSFFFYHTINFLI